MTETGITDGKKGPGGMNDGPRKTTSSSVTGQLKEKRRKGSAGGEKIEKAAQSQLDARVSLMSTRPSTRANSQRAAQRQKAFANEMGRPKGYRREWRRRRASSTEAQVFRLELHLEKKLRKAEGEAEFGREGRDPWEASLKA